MCGEILNPEDSTYYISHAISVLHDLVLIISLCIQYIYIYVYI